MNQILMDEKKVNSSISRLAHEIIEQNVSVKTLTVLGVKDRGDIFAKILCNKIKTFAPEIEIKYAKINPYHYRDDIKLKNQERPLIVDSKLIEGQNIILVDDVLFTGRTMRAAIDGILESGRAEQISLAVLVDRGHRQIPLKPDFVGKNLPTSINQRINVKINEQTCAISAVEVTAIAQEKEIV